ncbi:cysteine desulfurase NifS [Prosthecobacter algae]|uniref:cysteine desulfurase n=1 Tax=Prosthecobacter algae TaxID=1144682 RepID=A0ABP9NSH2_9BACT
MTYLDNNATTQPTARVVEAMLPYLTECYFNASASTATFTGADKPRREAAAAMSKLLNAEEPDCFIFTSGATESNNWVFSSFARGRKAGRVLVSTIEHASVSEPAAELARAGFEVVEVPVDAQGVVRIDALRDALREDTALVSIMAANNETGVLEPIAEIGRLIRELCPAALFHTDATQAVGKILVDLQGDWQDVDLLSFSAHKFHGPKGIGGLYIRPGFEVEPMILGGGQEQGLRSGTTNTPALAGLASAASEARNLNSPAMCSLRDTFEARLQDEFPEAVIHSRGVPRLPSTSCFSLPGMLGEEMVGALAAAGIIVGTGAACSAGAIQSSKTLRAMEVAHEIAVAGLRVSLSRYSTMQELTEIIVQLKAIRQELPPE